SPLPVYCHVTTPTSTYALSLHDALPIWIPVEALGHVAHSGAVDPHHPQVRGAVGVLGRIVAAERDAPPVGRYDGVRPEAGPRHRSEEHTSELQSRRDIVCRLLLEKKNDAKCNVGWICHGDQDRFIKLIYCVIDAFHNDVLVCVTSSRASLPARRSVVSPSYSHCAQ